MSKYYPILVFLNIILNSCVAHKEDIVSIQITKKTELIIPNVESIDSSHFIIPSDNSRNSGKIIEFYRDSNEMFTVDYNINSDSSLSEMNLDKLITKAYSSLTFTPNITKILKSQSYVKSDVLYVYLIYQNENKYDAVLCIYYDFRIIRIRFTNSSDLDMINQIFNSTIIAKG